jgi:hypothetical protein
MSTLLQFHCGFWNQLSSVSINLSRTEDPCNEDAYDIYN